jgi:hypothetical protein
MPFAFIHLHDARYDDQRLDAPSDAVLRRGHNQGWASSCWVSQGHHRDRQALRCWSAWA